MKSYYEQDGITIYHGDCREVLPEAARFDLLLTDPPYGLGEKQWGKPDSPAPKGQWKLHAGAMEWDNQVQAVDWLVARCGASIIWGGHLFGLPPRRGWLVWNKIVRNWSSGTCELAWTTLDIPVDTFDYSHGQLAAEGKRHPTQKPLPLMEWCIGKADKPGRVGAILDPFMGSGTTLVAAKNLGRRAVGVEREERYCEIAAQRLSQQVLDFGGAA